MSGIGVSVQHLLNSKPLKQQRNWVIDSGRGSAAPARGRPKRPTPGRLVHHLRLFAEVTAATHRHRPQVVHLHGSSHDLSFVGNWLSVSGAGWAGARTVWQLHQDLQVVQFPGTTLLTRGVFGWVMRTPDILA